MHVCLENKTFYARSSASYIMPIIFLNTICSHTHEHSEVSIAQDVILQLNTDFQPEQDSLDSFFFISLQYVQLKIVRIA